MKSGHIFHLKSVETGSTDERNIRANLELKEQAKQSEESSSTQFRSSQDYKSEDQPGGCFPFSCCQKQVVVEPQAPVNADELDQKNMMDFPVTTEEAEVVNTPSDFKYDFLEPIIQVGDEKEPRLSSEDHIYEEIPVERSALEVNHLAVPSPVVVEQGQRKQRKPDLETVSFKTTDATFERRKIEDSGLEKEITLQLEQKDKETIVKSGFKDPVVESSKIENKGEEEVPNKDFPPKLYPDEKEVFEESEIGIENLDGLKDPSEVSPIKDVDQLEESSGLTPVKDQEEEEEKPSPLIDVDLVENRRETSNKALTMRDVMEMFDIQPNLKEKDSRLETENLTMESVVAQVESNAIGVSPDKLNSLDVNQSCQSETTINYDEKGQRVEANTKSEILMVLDPKKDVLNGLPLFIVQKEETQTKLIKLNGNVERTYTFKRRFKNNKEKDEKTEKKTNVLLSSVNEIVLDSTKRQSALSTVPPPPIVGQSDDGSPLDLANNLSKEQDLGRSIEREEEGGSEATTNIIVSANFAAAAKEIRDNVDKSWEETRRRAAGAGSTTSESYHTAITAPLRLCEFCHVDLANFSVEKLCK